MFALFPESGREESSFYLIKCLRHFRAVVYHTTCIFSNELQPQWCVKSSDEVWLFSVGAVLDVVCVKCVHVLRARASIASQHLLLLMSPSLPSVRRQWAEFVWRKEDGTYWCCREWHHPWRHRRTGRRPRRQEAGPGRRIATRGQSLLRTGSDTTLLSSLSLSWFLWDHKLQPHTLSHAYKMCVHVRAWDNVYFSCWYIEEGGEWRFCFKLNGKQKRHQHSPFCKAVDHVCLCVCVEEYSLKVIFVCTVTLFECI